MTIEQYIQNINQCYKPGNATEHTFRGDLQQLIESLVLAIRATNEPKRQAYGAPDYIITELAHEVSLRMQPLRNRSHSFQIFWAVITACLAG